MVDLSGPRSGGETSTPQTVSCSSGAEAKGAKRRIRVRILQYVPKFDGWCDSLGAPKIHREAVAVGSDLRCAQDSLRHAPTQGDNVRVNFCQSPVDQGR